MLWPSSFQGQWDRTQATVVPLGPVLWLDCIWSSATILSHALAKVVMCCCTLHPDHRHDMSLFGAQPKVIVHDPCALLDRASNVVGMDRALPLNPNP
jgi:hypothetical protein